MTPLMRKARKGDRDAMAALYHTSKQRVLYICNVLLCDPKEADAACAHIFKNAWSCLLDESMTSEEDFLRCMERKAVGWCKRKILKKNNKAFRIPAGRNFVGIFETENIMTEGTLCEQVLANLPSLHRFIYITSTLLAWPSAEIAKSMYTNEKTIEDALAEEQENLTRILDGLYQKTGRKTELSVAEFHKMLNEAQDGCMVTRAIESAVISAMESAAVPLEQKTKQKRMKIALISVIPCLLIVGLVVGAVLLAGGNDAEPVDSSETETSDTTGADGEETEEPVDSSETETSDTTGTDGEETEEPVDGSETETSDTTGADGEETEEPVDGSAADTAAASAA